MTTQEAFQAGFMLKCASLGVPASFAETLFRKPKVRKSALLGTLLGGVWNTGGGALDLAGQAVQGAGSFGKELAGSKKDKSLPPNLSDEALQNLLLAAHYRKARQALLTPQNQAV